MPEFLSFNRYAVLGVPVSATTLATASQAIAAWAADRVGRCVFIRDVHGIMQAQMDEELMQLHYKAALVTPDGMPLVWLGRTVGHDVSRTCGPDLMDRILSESPRTGLKHYFFGGKPGVAELLKRNFERKYPGIQIVGVSTPPFRDLSPAEMEAIATDISSTNADVVWIGLSTPKQEKLMSQLVRHLGVTLIGVGAAFDFHTGAIKRAPTWMQHSGLEWAWRLASEPRRLWRRYLIMAPKFAWRVLTDRQSVRDLGNS